MLVESRATIKVMADIDMKANIHRHPGLKLSAVRAASSGLFVDMSSFSFRDAVGEARSRPVRDTPSEDWSAAASESSALLSSWANDIEL